MAWDYRLNTVVGSKLWLNTTEKKLLLAGVGGLGRREFRYDEIRSADFRKLNGELVGGFAEISIRTTDTTHSFFNVRFRWFGFDTWRTRLEAELNLLPAVRMRA